MIRTLLLEPPSAASGKLELLWGGEGRQLMFLCQVFAMHKEKFLILVYVRHILFRRWERYTNTHELGLPHTEWTPSGVDSGPGEKE